MAKKKKKAAKKKKVVTREKKAAKKKSKVKGLWTKDEVKLLRKLFANNPTAGIAAELGRPTDARFDHRADAGRAG